MSKEMIRIIVEGRPGSGKTTLALALKEFLESKKFEDVVIGIDDIDLQYGTHYPHLQPMRMEAIKDRHIVIETRPTPRTVKVDPEQG